MERFKEYTLFGETYYVTQEQLDAIRYLEEISKEAATVNDPFAIGWAQSFIRREILRNCEKTG